MKKSAKEAFGIIQDGQIIRIVHLRKDGAETYLLGSDSMLLDADWYKSDQAKASSADADFIPIDSQFMDSDELDISDMGSSESYETSDLPQQPRMEVSPVTLMFARFALSDGVVAVNLHDQHIIKDEPGKIKRADMARSRKTNMSREAKKAAAWQSCVIDAEGGPQHWLHTGPNLLLDAIINYGKESSTKLYFQLADANDVVLTEFYRFSIGDDLAGTNLFVYLGNEYRKLFVFQDGKWTQTLDIHITQDFPDAQVIYSKISLAMDSAQIGEPESIVLAGDLADKNLVEYVNSQSMSTKTSLISFPGLVVSGSEEGDEYNHLVLAKYSLAIALAYKALNTDDKHFSTCTFLPTRVIDSQKELRVVWHGFIVLSLIFALVLYSTLYFMSLRQQAAKEDDKKQALTITLNALRAENSVVEQLSAEIAAFRELSSNVAGVLKDKNRWTELFDIINSTFSTHRDSWISNLKKDGENLSITGVSSRRDYVSRLAEGLPNCKITSVTKAAVRNRTVWAFEMHFELPQLNWEDILLEDFVPPDTLMTSTSSPRTYRKYVPKKQVTKKTTNGNGKKSYRYAVLPYIKNEYTPGPAGDEMTYDPEMQEMYLRFVDAIEKGNQLEYRFTGHMILEKYPSSELAGLVRWWVAYRLYMDLEYRLARETLKPNLAVANTYLPHSKLLDARLSFAMAENSFKQKYEDLKAQHPGTQAAKQAAVDQKTIEGEYTR